MDLKRHILISFAVSCALLVTVYGKTTTEATSPTSGQTTPKPSPTPTKPQPTVSTPTVPPEVECARHSNTTCQECIEAANYKCFFCSTNKKCQLYPAGEVLPTKYCSLSDAKWGVCWVNFLALIVTMSVIGFIIILIITCCCVYCCCCRGGNKKKYMKEDAKWARQKAERKQRSEERRADRKDRMDEIRRKYGLVREDTPYQRFDA